MPTPAPTPQPTQEDVPRILIPDRSFEIFFFLFLFVVCVCVCVFFIPFVILFFLFVCVCVCFFAKSTLFSEYNIFLEKRNCLMFCVPIAI